MPDLAKVRKRGTEASPRSRSALSDSEASPATNPDERLVAELARVMGHHPADPKRAARPLSGKKRTSPARPHPVPRGGTAADPVGSTLIVASAVLQGETSESEDDLRPTTRLRSEQWVRRARRARIRGRLRQAFGWLITVGIAGLIIASAGWIISGSRKNPEGLPQRAGPLATHDLTSSQIQRHL